MLETAVRPVMVGLSHHGATMAELGALAVGRDALGEVLDGLVRDGFAEVVVLSTCSRTEIYGVAGAESDAVTARAAARLTTWSGLAPARVEAALTVLTGPAAVSHLFRVAAGLESLLVGDVDVLLQVRSAWRSACEVGTVGPLLARLFPASIRSAQQAQTGTGLGDQGRSFARRAVDVGLAGVGDRADPDILVVGSGQMARVACEHLAARSRPFRIAARDPEYGARLAGAERFCPLDDLVGALRRADLVLCATSAASPVITADHVREAVAGRLRPLTLVDLAVRPGIDAAVTDLPRVSLLDLVDLADDALGDPEVTAAVAEATALVDTAARAFSDDLAAVAAGPLIAALRSSVEQTCLEQLRRYGGPGDEDARTRVALAVAAKVLHRPTMLARSAAAAGDLDALRLICAAFDLPADRLLGTLTSG